MRYYYPGLFVIVLIQGLTLLLPGAHGQQQNALLDLNLASAKLPSIMGLTTTYYDGENFIYIFGGYSLSGGRIRDILRYDIDSDRVEKVSSLDVGSDGGVAFGSPDGRSIYYLGGADTYDSVYKFDTWSNTTQELMQSLPSESVFAAGIEYEGYGYIFDGWDDDIIIKFNLSTETATRNGELPEGTYRSIAAIMDTKEKKVWLFRSSPESTYSLLEFDLQTNELHSNPTFSPLPHFFMNPATVWDGNYGYIMGGFGEYLGSDGSPPPPTNGILRFNPKDTSTEFLPVANFPAGNNSLLDRTSAVYVERLNRIYLVGGSIRQNRTNIHEYQDKIWYIDISSPQVSCRNRTYGNYVNPSECSSFINCRTGNASVFSCPEPLLFDPLERKCNFPDIVDCTLTCEGKEGFFPHPNNCSLFLGCHEGSPDIVVYECPEPFLFDPVTLECGWPDLVQCESSLFKTTN